MSNLSGELSTSTFQWKIICFFMIFEIIIFQNTVQTVTYYGEPILKKNISNYYHGVGGKLYPADEEHLITTHLYYDAKTPDTVFYVGKTGLPTCSERIKVPYPCTNLNGSKFLDDYDGKDIELIVKDDVYFQDYNWTSVYTSELPILHRVKLDYGNITFLAVITLPVADVVNISSGQASTYNPDKINTSSVSKNLNSTDDAVVLLGNNNSWIWTYITLSLIIITSKIL